MAENEHLPPDDNVKDDPAQIQGPYVLLDFHVGAVVFKTHVDLYIKEGSDITETLMNALLQARMAVEGLIDVVGAQVNQRKEQVTIPDHMTMNPTKPTIIQLPSQGDVLQILRGSYPFGL